MSAGATLGGAYSTPSDPLAGFRGPFSKGRGRDEKEGEVEKSRKGERGGGSVGPKLKLGPQNYFFGTGVVEIAYWTSY